MNKAGERIKNESIFSFQNVLSISNDLLDARDSHSLLQKIADSAGKLLRADLVVLYEYLEELDEVRIPPIIWGNIKAPEVLQQKNARVPHKKSAVFFVLNRKEQQSIFSSNAKRDWRKMLAYLPQTNNFLDRESIISSTALCLKADNHKVGVLFINYRTVHHFSKHEKDIIQFFAAQAAIAIRHDQMRSDLLLYIQRLKLVNRISNELNEQMTENSIYQKAVDAISEILDCTNCTFFILDGNKLIPNAQATHSGKNESKITRKFRMTEGLVGQSAKSGKSILTLNARKHPNFIEGITKPHTDRSMISVPVHVNRQVIGVITADQDYLRAFTQKDLQIVQTIAMQVGTAIHNLKLMQHEKKRSIAADLLRVINSDISSTLDLKEILRLIVRGAIELSQASSGVIFLITNDSVTLKIEQPNEFQHPLPRLNNSYSITKKIITTGKLYEISDLARHPLVNPEMKVKGVKSILGLPLKIENEVIGVLYLNFSSYRRYTTPEKSMLKALAVQAEIAIENAKQYGKRVKDIEVLQRINERITCLNPKLDDILKLIVDELRAHFESNSCSIRLYDSRTKIFKKRIGSDKDEMQFFTPRSEGTSHLIVSTVKPIFANSPSFKLSNGKFAIRPELSKRGINTIYYLPLLSENYVIGILYFEWNSTKVITEQEKKLFELFSNQAALAIRNARRYENRLSDLAALHKINTKLAKSSHKSIADLIAKKARELTNADASALWLLNKTNSELTLKAWDGGTKPDLNILNLKNRSINPTFRRSGCSVF